MLREKIRCHHVFFNSREKPFDDIGRPFRLKGTVNVLNDLSDIRQKLDKAHTK